MFKYTLPVVLSLLILSACQNEPDIFSVGVIPDEDLIQAAHYDSNTDSASVSGNMYKEALLPYSSTILSIGRADGFDASALLRWQYIADTIGEGGKIISARMRLFSLPYKLGNDGPVELQIREITSFWSSFTFSTDSLQHLTLAPDTKGSAVQILSEVDSIDLPLDTAMVRDWLKKTNTGRFYEIYGVLLESSVSGTVRAFYSSKGERPPLLEIIIEQNGKPDTIAGQNLEDTYVASRPLIEEPGRIVLQGGAGVRGKLLFDVNAIPPNSIVNRVVLELNIDREHSTKKYRGIDSILVYINTNPDQNLPSSSGITTTQSAVKPTLLTAQGPLLIQAVQNWVNRRDNYGLILIKAAELSDLDQLAVYGADTESSLRPRLIVTYTREP